MPAWISTRASVEGWLCGVGLPDVSACPFAYVPVVPFHYVSVGLNIMFKINIVPRICFRVLLYDNHDPYPVRSQPTGLHQDRGRRSKNSKLYAELRWVDRFTRPRLFYANHTRTLLQFFVQSLVTYEQNTKVDMLATTTLIIATNLLFGNRSVYPRHFSDL